MKLWIYIVVMTLLFRDLIALINIEYQKVVLHKR